MVEKKRRHIALWLSVAVLLLLTALFFTVSITVSDKIPRLTEFSRSRLSDGVPFSTYEKLPNASYSNELAVCTETDAQFVDKLGAVVPVLVNENYTEVYGLRIKGKAFTQTYLESQIPAAIISDRAALHMSLDGNVIGQKITLFGKDFEIVGIYEKPDGFLDRLSEDFNERVYIPYTCCEDYREMPIDTFAAPKGSYSEKTLPLLGMTGSDPEFYIENDLAVRHDMLSGFVNFLISVIALVLLVVIIRSLSRAVKKTCLRLREDHQSLYFSGVLRKNRLRLLIGALVAVAALAVPVVLLILFPPKLVLPLNYIPDDNIFDLKHYLDVFINHLQTENAALAVGNHYYKHLFSISAILLSVLFIIVTVLIITVTVRIASLCRARSGKRAENAAAEPTENPDEKSGEAEKSDDESGESPDSESPDNNGAPE